MENTLLFLNGVLFSAMKLPTEMAMTPTEAKGQAKAYGALMAHYGLQPSKVIMLWTGAVAVTANVYGPRLIYLKAKAAKPQGRSQPSAPVVDFRTGAPVVVPEAVAAATAGPVAPDTPPLAGGKLVFGEDTH